MAPEAEPATVVEDEAALAAMFGVDAVGSFAETFADQFTDGGVERSDNSYRSANVSVNISQRYVEDLDAQVYVADMRYFERNLPNFVKAQGITDVLFSMCTYSVVGGNASCLTSLMTQDPDSEIVDEQPAISAKEAAEEAEAQRQAEEEARAAEEEAKAAEEAAEAAAQAAKDAGADAE